MGSAASTGLNLKKHIYAPSDSRHVWQSPWKFCVQLMTLTARSFQFSVFSTMANKDTIFDRFRYPTYSCRFTSFDVWPLKNILKIFFHQVLLCSYRYREIRSCCQQVGTRGEWYLSTTYFPNPTFDNWFLFHSLYLSAFWTEHSLTFLNVASTASIWCHPFLTATHQSDSISKVTLSHAAINSILFRTNCWF